MDIERTKMNLVQVVGVRLNPGTFAVYADRENGWTVEVQDVPSVSGTPWEGMLRVAITHSTAKTHKQFNDRRYRPAITWDQLQQIKDRLWPKQVAIEIFPPEAEIVNVAPMRWLWVLPLGQGLPFSINPRFPELGSSVSCDQPTPETHLNR